jgi:acetoin utilization protein AcuB
MAEKAKARRIRPAAHLSAASKRAGNYNSRVEYWMKMPVMTVKPRESVAHARALMEEHRINQLPVMFNGKLVGIVTDRDLRDATNAMQTSARVAGAQFASEDASPEMIPVEAVMSTNVFVIRPADTMQKAATLMRRERIGGLPVIDRGRMVGILTRSDVLAAFVALTHNLT